MSFSSLYSARGLAGYCLVFSVESFPAPLVWLFGLSLLLQSRSKMVNTRRKSQVLPIDPLAAEQSDSSTTSATRRSTRRSVGNVLATPVEIPTPTRRSRRLSNSSVESANNDTPRPGTRRSSRINKNAGSDAETSDVELVVIKRRKLGEGVDTLIPIREEKNEDRANPSEDKEKHILVELEEEIEDELKNKSNEVEELNKSIQAEVDDKIIKTEVVCKTIEAEVDSKTIKAEVESKTNKAEIDSKTNKAEIDSKCNESEIEVVLPSKEIEDKIIRQESPVKASKAEELKTEDTDSHEDKLVNVKLDEVDNSSLKSEIAIEIIEACKENSHSSEENHEKYFTPVSTPTNLIEVEDATKQTEKMDCSTSEEQQPLTTAEVASPKSHDGEQQQEENKCPQSPLKETNVNADSPVKSDVEKPRMLFGVPVEKITIGTALNMKKIGKHLYFSIMT
jgi:hypothetical protein